LVFVVLTISSAYFKFVFDWDLNKNLLIFNLVLKMEKRIGWGMVHFRLGNFCLTFFDEPYLISQLTNL
jgi:hypothetical protein